MRSEPSAGPWRIGCPFEGDGALCAFGAPAIQPDHAARALRAARRLHDELLVVGAAHPGVDAAIGVSAGVVVAGNVGTEQCYEYTGPSAPEVIALSRGLSAKPHIGRVCAQTSGQRADLERVACQPLTSGLYLMR